MKRRNKKEYDPREDIPYALLNWMILIWFGLYIVGEAAADKMGDIFRIIYALVIIITAVMIGHLAFKGSRVRFLFSPRTDPYGWVMKTGNKMKVTMKKLRYNYPEVVKKIRLKDTMYRVKITKKYKYHPNPTTIEEIK